MSGSRFDVCKVTMYSQVPSPRFAECLRLVELTLLMMDDDNNNNNLDNDNKVFQIDCHQNHL